MSLRRPKPVSKMLEQSLASIASAGANKRKRDENTSASSDRNTRARVAPIAKPVEVVPASKKFPIPSSSSAMSKKKLTPQEVRERLAETRAKLKESKDGNTANLEEIASLNEAIEALESTKDALQKSLLSATEGEAAGKRRISELENQCSECTATVATLRTKAAEAQLEYDQMNQKVASGLQIISSLQQDVFMRKAELSAAQSMIESQTATICQLKTETKLQSDRIDEMMRASHADELKRKDLHNQVQELKGNIRVFCRVRPATDGSAPIHLSFTDHDSLEISGRASSSFDGTSSSRQQHSFTFDRVFTPAATQEDVWQEISQLCSSAIDGYKVAVFAYGQTGSGKTFTMEGPQSASASNQGMIPRAITHIFDRIAQLRERSWAFELVARYLEVYNEEIVDLLTTGPSDGGAELRIKHGVDGSTDVIGAVIEKVLSPSDVHPLLLRASRNRSVAKTKLNERSSRSHSVFQLTIRGHNEASGQTTVGMLNLIDLAGSERLKKSESSGDTLKETQHINKSLSCLGDVIAALASRSKHVPFRNSKLTYLLQNSFGGDSKCLMFVNISPEEENLQESICSLRFASKVNSCVVGTARRNTKQQ